MNSKIVYTQEIEQLIYSNRTADELLKTERNRVSVHTLNDGKKIVLKAFKVPNLINQIAYRYFRKSKAKRSYEYAQILRAKTIGTPEPLAYFENFNLVGLQDSYYACEYIEADLTYRELTFDFEIPDYEIILRAFTRFTYDLHAKEIHFLDHSPGNTLIQKRAGEYQFFLVDLNRMEFGPMSIEARIQNFSKLTTHKSMVRIMSNEYSKLVPESEAFIFERMWRYTQEFQEEYHRKRRIKRKLFFWKEKYKS